METVTKDMPSPALYTNFEILSGKPRAFPLQPALPTSKNKNGHKRAWGKAAESREQVRNSIRYWCWCEGATLTVHALFHRYENFFHLMIACEHCNDRKIY